VSVRLQKYLADCGVASRRASEKLIAGGMVTVNGAVVTEMGVLIDPGADRVAYNGKPVVNNIKPVYIMLNKPRGYVTTARDQFGRLAVTDLVNLNERLFPVGRLDCDTSGLLILTNDGGLAHKLTHPKFTVEKTYIATVAGVPAAGAFDALTLGVDIGGYVTQPARVEILETRGEHTDVKIIISEGKNRQVKKMCAAIGYPSIRLTRTAVGRLTLGTLKEGQWRRLTRAETDYLQNM